MWRESLKMQSQPTHPSPEVQGPVKRDEESLLREALAEAERKAAISTDEMFQSMDNHQKAMLELRKAEDNVEAAQNDYETALATDNALRQDAEKARKALHSFLGKRRRQDEN